MKKLFFLSCMLIMSISFAKKWDATYIGKLIAKGEIDKVIQYYQERYYSDNRDPQDAFRIAELYVKKKEYATAMQWYDKENQLIYTSKLNLFNYAYANQLMGNYQKALDGYLMYAAQTGDVNKVMDLANQCEKILKASSQTASYKLENYPYNTANNELDIAVLRTNPVYIVTDSRAEKESNDIYQVVREYDKFSEPVKAYKSGADKLIITGLSYTQDGNSLVFSAREPGSSKSKTKHDKLYFAENLGANFLHVKPFPYNVEGASLTYPAFNTNGTAVYFSSNQAGGFGGYDIWESKLEKGQWTKPVNLGKLLNTTSDELHPFIVQDGKNHTLYFSSDREGGFGGFDIYKASNSSGIWQDVEMQPAPVNSAGDDKSIIYDDEVRTGYFTSNRAGGKGGFDVYRFIPFNLKLVVNTYDSLTEKIVDYAMVQVLENGNKVYEGVTNENGKAVFQVDKNKTFTLKLSKDNYRTISTKINTDNKGSGDSVVVDVYLKQDEKFAIKNSATNTISLDNYIIFTGRVVDAATNKPAKVKMRMVNYTTQKLRELDIDAEGKFEIKLLLNNNYKVIFETPENKITDELTTLGMERNSVKVRDYLLTGNKFKLTENRVYKEGTLPPGMNIKSEWKQDNSMSKNTFIANEPITQAKVDSLLKVISKDNQPATQASKTTAAKTMYVSVPEVKQEALKAIAETKITETAKVVETKKGEVKETIKEAIEEKPKAVVETSKAEAPIETPTVAVQEKPVMLKGDTTIVKEIKPVVQENDGMLLAADMVATKKSKKVKILSKNDEEIKEAETSVVDAKPAEIAETEAIEPVIEKITEPVATAGQKTTSKQEEPVKETIKKEVKEAIIQAPKQKPVSEKVPDKIPATVAASTKQAEPVKEELPELYYKIQLASYDIGNVKFPELEHLGKIEEVKAYDRYIYRLGNFDDLERAKEILAQVRSQGYFVAFILQYSKDKVTGIVN